MLWQILTSFWWFNVKKCITQVRLQWRSVSFASSHQFNHYPVLIIWWIVFSAIWTASVYVCLWAVVWCLKQWCCTLTVYPVLVGIWWTALSETILPVACDTQTIQNSLWKHIKGAFVIAFQRATFYLYALFPELAMALKWHLLEKWYMLHTCGWNELMKKVY